MESLIIATTVGAAALICAWMAIRYGEIAERGAAAQAATSKSSATWWATAAAILGLIGVFIGAWA
jgi:hypothetical protein